MFEHISQIRSLHIEYEVAIEQLLSYLSIDRKKPLVYWGEEKLYEPPQEDEKPRSGFRDPTIPCENFSLPPTTFQQPSGPTRTLCDVSTLALLSLNFENRGFVAVTTYRCRVRFRQPANLVNLELSHFYSQSTIPDLRFIRLRHFNVLDFYY